MTRDTSWETVERQGASMAAALHMVPVATLGGRVFSCNDDSVVSTDLSFLVVLIHISGYCSF